MACTNVQIQSSVGRKVLIEPESSVLAGQLPRSGTVPSRIGRYREGNGRLCAVVSSRGASESGDLAAALKLARDGEDGDLWWGKSGGTKDQEKKPTIAPQLDQLMKESVTEIVKNISEAPFLVHIYSSKDTNNYKPITVPNPSNLIIEKASSDDWPSISRRWEDRSGSPGPDGIILVEELGNEDLNTTSTICCDSCSSAASNDLHLHPPPSSSSSNSTKVWGLLVQGRGVSYPSCYILKTCQIQCCFGLSTHFSLTKVDCFGVSADYHLSKMWLQR